MTSTPLWRRVCSAEVPMPYAKHLEDEALPQVADVVAAVHGAGSVNGRLHACRRSVPTWTPAPSREWLVKPGDEVHRGDIVAVVETEKSTIEVEIFESGTIDELLVPEGERVPVGTVLAHITARAPSAAPQPPSPPPASARPAPRVVPEKRTLTAEPTPPAPAPVAPHLPIASPIIRHLAEQTGVDLAALSGTGPGGSVTRADVERAAQRPRDEGSSGQPTTERRPVRRVTGPKLWSVIASTPPLWPDGWRANSASISLPFRDQAPAGRSSSGMCVVQLKLRPDTLDRCPPPPRTARPQCGGPSARSWLALSARSPTTT